MTRERYWAALTTEEFAALDPGATVALLPVGAVEQHGPHLPVSVDADICRAIVSAVVAGAPPELPLLVLPAMEVGVSPEHADFPGTLSLAPETMLAVLAEIGESVYRGGLRKLAILNTHGGQPQILDLACQRLRRRHGMVAVALNAYRYWDAAAAFGAEEAAWGIHGGAAETSIMLWAHPDAVREDKVADFPNAAKALAGRMDHFRAYGREANTGWQMQDLNPEGAAGDARLATADAGEALIREAAAKALAIIKDLAALDAAAFVRPGPAMPEA